MVTDKKTAELSSKLASLLDSEPPIILCIGSDKVAGDSVGPLVGRQLVGVDAYVYGTVGNTVNASNLESVIEQIKVNHPQKQIIAIDSSLGKKEDIGKIKIYKGSLIPGNAAKKILPEIGDISIKVVVNEMSSNAMMAICGVCPKFAYSLAETVATILKNALDKTRQGVCQ